MDVFFTCEVGTLTAVPVSICRSYRRLGLSNIFPNCSLPRLSSYLQYRGRFQRTTGLERVLDLEKMAIECRETFTSAVTCPEPRGRSNKRKGLFGHFKQELDENPGYLLELR